MDKKGRKELLASYKERKVTGGVCAVKNTANGKVLLLSAVDLSGIKNRYEFAQSTGGFIHMKLQDDWKKYGSSAFTFEVLDQIDKNEMQTSDEFSEEVELLKEIWSQKYEPDTLY